jgi:type I restriction enzyme S subunit
MSPEPPANFNIKRDIPELQREFARRVAVIDVLKKSHRALLGSIDELFASLQHRAFRGEL